MTFSLNRFILIFFLSSTVVFSQKYSSTTHESIKTSYKGNDFTSDKTLLENLSEIEEFSVFSEMIESYGEAIFTEDFMGTVFVIVDSGFEQEVEGNDENEVIPADVRKKILTFLIVPGRLDAHGIRKAIENGGGTAYFATLNGEKLGAKASGERLFLFDLNNNTSEILAADLYHRHGFFHIISGVLAPKMD